MKINFSKNRVDKKLLDMVQVCFDKAVDYLQIPCKDLEVNIAIVRGREIKKLNTEFRNVDKVTDVLSFPFLLQEGVTGDQEIASKLTEPEIDNPLWGIPFAIKDNISTKSNGVKIFQNSCLVL